MTARSFSHDAHGAGVALGRPPVSMRRIAVLQISPMLLTSPGMALSGQTV
jgi:hypothetical protein